jgi:hypothetical protein
VRVFDALAVRAHREQRPVAEIAREQFLAHRPSTPPPDRKA